MQAYALCRVLNEQGYDAEQISYDKTGDSPFAGQSAKGISRIARRAVSGVKRAARGWRLWALRPELESRNAAIMRFNQNIIPHSAVYRKNSIDLANDQYDVFITGSDQVWHPKAVCSGYLLDFVREGKVKLSYGASISQNQLPNGVLDRYRSSLASFDAVSVRERDAVDLIGSISPVEVQWVLDPVFLLERKQWDEICTDRRGSEPYLFCYFLGDSPDDRRLAAAYALRHGLKIVNLPHLNGKFHRWDAGFGDDALYDVSPADFVTLIKYAECVFTDSFHAAAFSTIYQKELFVFPRNGHNAMATRIHSLLELTDAQERFCAQPAQMDVCDIEAIPPLAYHGEFPKLEEMKERSRSFLMDTLSKAKEKLQKYES